MPKPETVAEPVSTSPYPEPRIKRRIVDTAMEKAALAHGLSPVAARVIASRQLADGSDVATFLSATMADLDPPRLLKDIDRAAKRIADAVMNKEVMVPMGDFDCDGNAAITTMLSIMLSCFGHDQKLIIPIVGSRFTDGYGLTDSIVDRILALPVKVSLLVTMDCGSSDEQRIARLRAAGIDTIVTDHHEVPSDGAPKSAYATVNPNQPGCSFPDKNIAGCHTIWLVMAATRQELIHRGYLPEDAPSLAEFSDYTAISTIADCVSIASKNNRVMIRAGLKRINAGMRPAWRAIRPYLVKKSKRPVTAETIAYGLAPRINAPGRMQDAMRAVNFLLSKNEEESVHLAELLDQENQGRRDLEQKLKEMAMVEACEQVEEGRLGISIFLAEGHTGLSGLVASRLVEAFGRPTIVFARKQDTEDLVGSARSIEFLHIRDVLQEISEKYPELIKKFGGHAMAAGLQIDINDINLFMRAFDMSVRRRVKPEDIGPVIWTDGPLAPGEITLGTVEAISVLEPFGRKFEAPRFEGEFQVLEARPVGKDKTHLQLLLCAAGHEKPYIKAIWFRARRSESEPLPVDRDDLLYAVYQLDDDDHGGHRKVALKISHGRRIQRPEKKPTKRYI